MTHQTTNNEWSDGGVQVLDLKAAGALSCSSVIEAIRTGVAGHHTSTIMLVVPCMHHAPSRRRWLAEPQRRRTANRKVTESL